MWLRRERTSWTIACTITVIVFLLLCPLETFYVYNILHLNNVDSCIRKHHCYVQFRASLFLHSLSYLLLEVYFNFLLFPFQSICSLVTTTISLYRVTKQEAPTSFIVHSIINEGPMIQPNTPQVRRVGKHLCHFVFLSKISSSKYCGNSLFLHLNASSLATILNKPTINYQSHVLVKWNFSYVQIILCRQKSQEPWKKIIQFLCVFISERKREESWSMK